MLTFRLLNKVSPVKRCHGVTLWPACSNAPPPNTKLLGSLSVVGFTAKTSTASCKTARTTARQPRGGDCFIYCRLSFRRVDVCFCRILNVIFFESSSLKNQHITQHRRHAAFAQYRYHIPIDKSAGHIQLLVDFACWLVSVLSWPGNFHNPHNLASAVNFTLLILGFVISKRLFREYKTRHFWLCNFFCVIDFSRNIWSEVWAYMCGLKLNTIVMYFNSF